MNNKLYLHKNMNIDTLANRINAYIGADLRTIKDAMMPFNSKLSARKLVMQRLVKTYAVKILNGETCNSLDFEIKELDKRIKAIEENE